MNNKSIFQLSKTPYKKARGELMWTLLQYVSCSSQKITADDCTAIFELYHLLYADEESKTGTVTDSVHLVRFLAPACLYLHLVNLSGVDNVPQPSASLQTQINFLDTSLHDENFEDFMLAVMVNACECHMRVYISTKFLFLDNTNAEIFKKTIIPIIQSRLESSTDNEVWTLPLGRTTAMKVKPFRLASLDAMTVQGKLAYVLYSTQLV